MVEPVVTEQRHLFLGRQYLMLVVVEVLLKQQTLLALEVQEAAVLVQIKITMLQMELPTPAEVEVGQEIKMLRQM
jgi:hypothetical protein